MSTGGSFDFSEEDIRSWCDGISFARGDALQQAGHVQEQETNGAQLTAAVLGTWSRMDRATVEQQGSRLVSMCTCGSSTLCRHCVAVVLQWVRKPDTFRTPAREHFSQLAQVAANRALSPQEQMEELLHRRTLPELRALAKRRGLPVKGQLKDEYVARLAALLIQPENIAIALEGLGDQDLLLLTLIDVLRQNAGAPAPRVNRAFAVLQRRSQSERAERDTVPPSAITSRLEELGLLIRPTYQGGPYDVPRAVIARTPCPRALLNLFPDRSGEVDTTGPEAPPASPIDLMQIVALEASRGAIEAHLPPEPNTRYGGPPPGWDLGDRHEGRGTRGGQQFIPASTRLVPHRPVLRDRDRNRLAGQIGASAEQIEFIAELMVELDILQPHPGAKTLNVDRQHLDRLLELGGPARWRALASAWLALSAVSDLRLLCDTFELRVSTNHLQWYGHELLEETTLRAMVARLIGHLASAQRWYSLSDLAGLWETIAPDALYRARDTVPTWWYTPPGRPLESFMPNTPDGRRLIYEGLLGALLQGPLYWLGMVDIVEADAGLLFRPRSRASVLADREPDVDEAEPGSVSLSIEADTEGTPIVTLSVTGDDEMALFLASVSEPLQPSSQGMRYRVTGLSLQHMFAAGIGGPELVAWLEGTSRSGVPESVKSRILRAWESYGTVRLYDDLTVVELGDDFLLQELEAVTDLRGATIHVFSPRLLAIDAARVPSLVAAMTKAGHRPRLVESA